MKPAVHQQSFAGSALDLVGDVAGPEDGPAVLFMHGGGQTRHSWGGALLRAAERGYRAVSLDLRGHGDSDWSDGGSYHLSDYVADARAVVAALDRPVAIVGASLGGLIGLLVAGESQPGEQGSSLVLVDVAPRIEAEGTNQVAGFMQSAPDGFASLEEAADAVSAYLPHRPRPSSLEGLRKNLREGADGRFRWQWDPKMITSGRLDPRGSRDRLEQAARHVAVPLLLVRGAMSQVVSDRSVQEFRALAPAAEYVNVGGADHMVAGDRNDAFNEAVFGFLDRHAPPR